MARRPLEEEGVYLDGGRRTTQLMRDSLGGLAETMTRRSLLLAALVVTGADTALYSAACTGDHRALWDPPISGSVVVRDSSPDHLFTAQVVADDSPGVYLFQIMTLPHRNVIAARRIAAPVGYHPQRLSLRWEGMNVIATIDHDFGEDNLEFTLSAQR